MRFKYLQTSIIYLYTDRSIIYLSIILYLVSLEQPPGSRDLPQKSDPTNLTCSPAAPAAPADPISIEHPPTPSESVAAQVAILKQAALSRKVPVAAVFDAVAALETARLDSSPFLQKLGGGGAPGGLGCWCGQLAPKRWGLAGWGN